MPYLRTLDALHLEAALRLDALAVLTYDRRLGEATRALGLDVIAPWHCTLSGPTDQRRWS